MGTKRTKKEEPAVPAAKPAPKRKVVAGPAAASVKKPVVAEIEPAKPAKAAAKATPAKAPATKPTRKPAAKTAAATPAAVPVETTPPAPPLSKVISLDAIALRAYFIGEARQSAGLPGDSTTDWLEAERQLQAES